MNIRKNKYYSTTRKTEFLNGEGICAAWEKCSFGVNKVK
jgi:hypothetical protein